MTSREQEILNWIKENPMISQQDLAEKAGITRSSVAVHISNLIKKGYIAGKGYVINPPEYAVVLGGVNIDIGGRPDKALIPADSNPGKVSLSLGGVGRNIAHNLALLGTDIKLITAVGSDTYGQKIIASCNEIGIDFSCSLQVQDEATSTYMFISDERGDMVLAVSDMDIYNHVTPSLLEAHKNILTNARLIVIDTNIPQESIAWLTENVETPVFADPVSSTKAEKLRPVLGKLHTLKPNRIEAELLSGVSITDDESLNRAADVLLSGGLKQVFISLGSDGVFAANTEERVKIPCFPSHLVNATGAGDAFMAAISWAYLNGYDLRSSAIIGQAASSIAIEGENTINPDMSVSEIKKKIRNVYPEMLKSLQKNAAL